jgi:hypothetical protein
MKVQTDQATNEGERPVRWAEQDHPHWLQM